MKFRAKFDLRVEAYEREIRKVLVIPTVQERDDNDSYFLLIIEA